MRSASLACSAFVGSWFLCRRRQHERPAPAAAPGPSGADLRQRRHVIPCARSRVHVLCLLSQPETEGGQLRARPGGGRSHRQLAGDLGESAPEAARARDAAAAQPPARQPHLRRRVGVARDRARSRGRGESRIPAVRPTSIASIGRSMPTRCAIFSACRSTAR